jgi:putative tryptophan/tyrosine transport system substrate-binding protein
MRRRDFITLLGGATVGWPLAARAQQLAMPVIGFLALPSRDTFGFLVDAFHLGLGETGYVEGKNVAIEYRWADNQVDGVPALAADLVGRRVAVIVAVGSLAVARAAKAATTTIPILFNVAGDPVRSGLVASLNRPGGNATGVTLFSGTLLTKRLEVARELIPGNNLVAVLMNPTSPDYGPDLKEIQDAARAIGQQILVLDVSMASEFAAAFETLVQQHAQALLVMTDVLFNSRRDELVTLAARHAVPMVHFLREAVVAGGLMSYGGNIPDLYRHIGAYAGRILKGERPADLPVLQPTKVELVINLKTAKALGITVPNTLIGRADEVIE